jgi:hypothetical protein
MDTWEFLLQQEGEDTWHSLESPAVEIEEGRYRLAVRSSCNDTAVDIRIIYDSIYDELPKRRIQHQSRCTTSDGLMVVISFNYLKAGIWEFCCRPDFISDTVGEARQYTLTLQVVPVSAASDAPASVTENGFTEKINSKAGETPTPQETSQKFLERSNESESVAVVNTNSLATETVLQEDTVIAASSGQSLEKSAELNSENLAETDNASSNVSYKSVNISPGSLQISLEEEALMTRAGGILTISGRVQTRDAIAIVGFRGEVQICLRDPQNFQVLLEVRQNLPVPGLPSPFSYNLKIPSKINTRLMLGEINLYQIEDITEDSPASQVLATASFTVTGNVDELLGAIAKNLAAKDQQVESKTNSPNPSDPDETPKAVPTIDFEPKSGIAIPPLLNKSTLKQRPRQPLQLPYIPSREQPKPKPKPDISIEEETKDSEEVSDITEENKESELVTNLTEEESETTGGENEAKESSSIVPLRSQDEFFERLNALATDEALSDALKESPILDPLTIDLDSLFANNDDPDAHLTALEIVVDDEPLELTRNQTTKQLSAAIDKLPEDEPIPTPKLEVLPTGDLASGQKVRVRVTLAHGLPLLGVKLWISDPQVRSLLEEPRWVGEFNPNGWGEYEALTQFTIPFGCLEIRFEAIATELQTKRESHKVTVNRIVIPPDLPSEIEEEFQF